MKYVIANWKMNFGLEDIRNWYQKFSVLVAGKEFENTKIIVAPSAVHIPILNELFSEIPVELSSQDFSEYEKGAKTGYLGAFQMKDFCEYSIIGHSERKEPMEIVLKKRDLAIKNGIKPMVCFTSPENATMVYNHDTLLVWEDPNNISVEGQYRQKDPEEIKIGIEAIRKEIPVDGILIYGGSVNNGNISDLNGTKGIDGVLVGNASLDPEHFFDILVEFVK